MTSLYVELVVIGLQTSIWIVLTIANIAGADVLTSSFSALASVPLFTLLLGLFYIVGMVFDRFADLIFQSTEDKIRDASGFAGKTTSAVWAKNQLNEFFRYQRTRIRIVRATIVNTLPILISLICFIIMYTDRTTHLAFFTFSFCLGVFIISITSHKKMLQKYYEKAKIFEASENILEEQ